VHILNHLEAHQISDNATVGAPAKVIWLYVIPLIENPIEAAPEFK
jgi:hypothetical protein